MQEVPVAPRNNVIVKISQRFYDSVKFDSGVVLYFDPSWDPSEYAMLEGVVESVPRSIMKRKDYEGFSADGIKRGDRILFRYDVIFSYLSQPDRDSVRFKNEIWWHETSYWKVDIQKIFCTVHGDAKSFSGLKYSMLNGYVLCDLITEYKSDLYSDNIIRPESEKMVVRLDRAKVKAIGENNLEVQPGDTIWFSPKIPQVYSLNRKKFIIVSQRHILAVT
ncbi:MAG TPA: hypothetical protein VGZ90_13375 [Puia sp.]|nr:hypothetical protein [Puia sp.]